MRTYAPTANSPTPKKTTFYKKLDGSTSIFHSKPGHRVLVGDFNARLGSITGDHGTNSNKDILMDFLNNDFLVNINLLKTFLQCTFHDISTGDKSIIDLLLTVMLPCRIPNHKILDGSLGTSAQTAHKAILTKILIGAKEELSIRKNTAIPRW